MPVSPRSRVNSEGATILRNVLSSQYVELTSRQPEAAAAQRSTMNEDDLVSLAEATYHQVAAPFVRSLDLRVLSAGKEQTVLRLPITPELVHAGGVLCGQAMLAAADTAMVLAL